MIAATSSTAVVDSADRRLEQVSLLRLLWVAPLTLVVALAACYAIRFVAQSLNPGLARMPMLQMPMTVLAIEGVLAANLVFALMAVLATRPIFWYRIVGGVALLLSLLPDVALAIGSPGAGGPGGPAGSPPPGGFPGGPPPGFMSLEQVAVLMVLHIAVAAVCIGLLTTLTPKRPVTALA